MCVFGWNAVEPKDLFICMKHKSGAVDESSAVERTWSWTQVITGPLFELI